MRVDERIVVKMSKTTARSNARSKTAWAKRAVRTALWEIRKKILDELGLAIYNVFVYTDRVEVSIAGELDATDIGDTKYFAKKR